MAQKPTPEQTRARHLAKLIDHDFVDVEGSSLCGHRTTLIDPIALTMTLIQRTEPIAGEQRVCGAQRHRHRNAQKGVSQ